MYQAKTGSTITVNWGINSGNVTVKAVNNCGTSTTAATLNVSTVNKSFTAIPSSLLFDTTCVNGTSTSNSFKLTATGLNGNNVTVGPLTGYQFCLTNGGNYTNSVNINGYGSNINQSVFVKFNPLTVNTFISNIPITGGGASPGSVAVTGYSVNSSPTVTANIINVTCNGLKNGSIDLSTTGGTGPFTYKWTGNGTFDKTLPDISGLSPNSYTVAIGSYAGCSLSKTYNITQPDQLTLDLSADPMACKNGTTTVHVNATGGTMPYTGTGVFTDNSGVTAYTVTDAHGCTTTKSINVPNGSGVAPSKPGIITGATADAQGLCGGGDFTYSVDAVSTATYYTWTAPSGSTISSTSNGGKQAVLTAPSNFSTGTLTVAAGNACGLSVAQSKSLTSLPGKPTINGPVSVTALQSNVTYSTPAVDGVTVYAWTFPGSVTILSGSGTPTIKVKWGNYSGNVNLAFNNACGLSPNAMMNVTVVLGLDGQSDEGSSMIAANTKNMMIFPNPAKDVAYFTFDAASESKYSVTITNLAGKLIEQKSIAALKGTNKITLDVHNYANGLYLVTLINSDGSRSTTKLVKE